MELSTWRRSAKTAESRDTRGWATVGDIGYVDRDGYLFLTDRRHHMIISGGVNIYPQEAEDTLITHPRVLDAAVFESRRRNGTSVKAVVGPSIRPTPLQAPQGAAGMDERERLAHYKCPRSISFEAALPRTDAGKLHQTPAGRALFTIRVAFATGSQGATTARHGRHDSCSPKSAGLDHHGVGGMTMSSHVLSAGALWARSDWV